MTTAHRPTFDPARGKEAQRGPAYHQRLLPAHTHLKLRQRGQGGAAGLSSDTDASLARDFRQELLQAEASNTNASDDTSTAGAKRKAIAPAPDAPDEEEDPEAKRRRVLEVHHDEDASSASESQSNAASSSSSEDESDSDDEAALRRELERIKAERAAARQKEEAAKAAKEQEEREYDIARGNPLLNGDGGGGGSRDYGVRRRWDDDVVFKNQARGTEEREKRRGKDFVNDLLRSDFHRRFMGKYVR